MNKKAGMFVMLAAILGWLGVSVGLAGLWKNWQGFNSYETVGLIISACASVFAALSFWLYLKDK